VDAFFITDSTLTTTATSSGSSGTTAPGQPSPAWVVHPHGDLDAFSATRLLDHTTAALAGRPPGIFLLDLSEVGFMDSVGLGVCTATLKRARAAGHHVALIAPQTPIRRLLARTGIARAYLVHRTLDQALTHGAAPATPAA